MLSLSSVDKDIFSVVLFLLASTTVSSMRGALYRYRRGQYLGLLREPPKKLETLRTLDYDPVMFRGAEIPAEDYLLQ
uniref:Small integral membrane protein 29 n=1 Tax=Syphacia muris TaxID=451379 RepID=A0A0N5AAP2_9BILA